MKTKRTRCATEGCKRLAPAGEDLCAKCAEAVATKGGNGASQADPVFAEDLVLKLSQAELDKFNLLRLKQENKLQAIRVQELEQERADREYVHQKHTRSQIVEQIRRESAQAGNEYLDYVRALAKKYHLEPTQMGIDDETGVLRDLRPKQEETT